MPRIVVRPRASVGLAEIWAFIAEDSIKHAHKFAALIDDHFEGWLADPRWAEADQNWRQTFAASQLNKYVIFYLPLPNGVEIVRVLHGARDIESILREDD